MSRRGVYEAHPAGHYPPAIRSDNRSPCASLRLACVSRLSSAGTLGGAFVFQRLEQVYDVLPDAWRTRVDRYAQLVAEIEADVRAHRLRMRHLRRQKGVPEYVPSDDVQPTRLPAVL